nr:nitrous oxide reductase maturation transmembrane protein [uncultured bacterium]
MKPRRILAIATTEFHIARRNRWVAIAVALMVVFSLVLSAAGSAPTGGLGVDRLSVVVASLISLSVYLVPLVALLMSFDAVAGEVERGTLPLLLTYPVARAEVLLGKLVAHLGILTLAVCLGYGAAALTAMITDPAASVGLPALWRLTWSSILLGATFLGAGYALSSLSRRPSGAAGLAIGLWLGLVVLYDLGLLAAIVADNGGWFTTRAFPVALLANPADAFRLFNLTSSQAGMAAAGVSGAAGSIPAWQSLISTLIWPFVALLLATATFRRVTP